MYTALARAKRADQIFVIVGKEEHQAKTARIYIIESPNLLLDFKNFKYTELAPQNHVKMDGTELDLKTRYAEPCAELSISIGCEVDRNSSEECAPAVRADAGLASGRDVTLVTRRVVRSARAMPSPAAGASGTHVRSVSLAKFESVNAKTRLGVERGAPNGHDKILELRAERHRDAAASDPNDHDALYGWALVLQEQAERAEAAGVDVSRRLAYLADACDKYARARAARPRFHAALYNHGIALGDRARATADPAAARALWLEACEKYRAAVECDASRAGAVQALNNWGLASRQIAALSPTAEEKNARLLASVGLFREALRRDPTFHRAAYNLGTIFYALSERAQRRARAVDDASTVEDAAAANAAVAVSAEELQTAAAMYICCARAAAPEPVYASSLRLVRHTLPLPALAAGSLLASPPRLAVATRGCWTRRWFVLDHEAFWTGEAWPEGGGPVDGGAMGAMGTWAEVPRPRATRTQLDAPETRGGDVGEGVERESTPVARANAAEGGAPWGVHVRVDQIVSVQPCADVSLPRGFGLHVGLDSGRGVFLVADSEAARETWVDALWLARTLAAGRRAEALRAELASDVSVAPQLKNNARGYARR